MAEFFDNHRQKEEFSLPNLEEIKRRRRQESGGKHSADVTSTRKEPRELPSQRVWIDTSSEPKEPTKNVRHSSVFDASSSKEIFREQPHRISGVSKSVSQPEGNPGGKNRSIGKEQGAETSLAKNNSPSDKSELSEGAEDSYIPTPKTKYKASRSFGLFQRKKNKKNIPSDLRENPTENSTPSQKPPTPERVVAPKTVVSLDKKRHTTFTKITYVWSVLVLLGTIGVGIYGTAVWKDAEVTKLTNAAYSKGVRDMTLTTPTVESATRMSIPELDSLILSSPLSKFYPGTTFAKHAVTGWSTSGGAESYGSVKLSFCYVSAEVKAPMTASAFLVSANTHVEKPVWVVDSVSQTDTPCGVEREG